MKSPHVGQDNGNTLTVLVIDDSENDTLLLLRELRKGGYQLDYERVETPDQLHDALERSNQWQVAITDHNLPGFDSSEALQIIRRFSPDLPVIIVSGTIGEDVAVRAMRSGICDYIMKDNLTRLIPAIERELREAASRRAKHNAEKALHHLSYHDPLTNLVNRTLFRDRLQHALVRSKRSGFKVAVLMIDLDRFKVTNDSLGHDIGDEVLREVARRLLACARQEDTIARFGGDEFIVILEGCSEPSDASSVADEVLSSLSTPFYFASHEIFIGASIGITLRDGRIADGDEMIRGAEVAMRRAKELGRNRYHFFSNELVASERSLYTLENELHHALERQQFELHYQPQVDTQTNLICGAEALLRWNHPKFGVISPVDFIPLLEETGLIVPVGEWVLSTACEQWQKWSEEGILPTSSTIAVNLSSIQFRAGGLFQTVDQALNGSQLPANQLDLEITEGILMEDTETCISTLYQLKQRGVSITVDDFGTGYSSLAYLKKFPLDQLKIDRSFVKDVVTDSDDRAIATAIIGLSHNLRLQVIAEGVESGEILDFLRQQGCDYYQGYYLSKPLPADQFRELLLSKNAG